MGSPAFAVPSLKALHAAGHEIVCVYTQPPRPAGRGQKDQPTAVQMAATDLGITDIRCPVKLRGEDLGMLLATGCDAICVVAYGLLLPKALVDARLCLNVHPSALPRWRGAAPIQHTLLAGDGATEVCIMKLDEGMDTGPVFGRTPLTVSPTMTAGELHDLCAEVGAIELGKVLSQLPGLEAVPQVGHATHAGKITAEMKPIDWTRTAWEAHNHIRALSPSPGATMAVKGEVVKVLRSRVEPGTGAPGTVVGVADGLDVACGDGVARLLEIQRPGKKAMGILEALNGWGLKVGDSVA